MESRNCRIPPFPLLWNPLLLPYSTALIMKLQKKYSISCPSVMIPYPLPSSKLTSTVSNSPKIESICPSSPSSSISTSNESSSPSTPSPLLIKMKKDRDCHCEICGKTFGRHWLLQGHLPGEKPFICNVCGKAFADKSNLRAHVQTHSSEKPHHCSRCGKRFALKSYLSKHEESACYRSSSTALTAREKQLHSHHFQYRHRCLE
ncbi:zinc finger, C2H2 type [Dictyocaulus viviparus]|uniref:Zinc finger, C2H2 type n=1 Tax=Dictyocaulus viviparus TaxID=29172 RepID=A0A0D8YBA6_DICVI|nr:zinc finger, C2H2 type [Dictyocaulus viviparus]